MANGVSTVISGIIGVAAAATAGAAVLRRDQPYQPAGHALSTGDDINPLPGVLTRGLGGLTVAVQPGPHGELFIGPGQPIPGRTLRRLVLSPLVARAQARGGRLRHDQRAPFRLVVRFAGPGRDPATLMRAYRLLDRQLRDAAPVLSRCVGGRPEPGAITVALTGIVDVRALLAGQHERYAFVDATLDDLGSPAAPPALAPMVSEAWHRRFGWDGEDEIPAEERHLLHALVRETHSDGRTIRFSGLPTGSRAARRAVWTELLRAGVDVVAAEDQRELARFLRGRSRLDLAPREPAGSPLPGPRPEPA